MSGLPAPGSSAPSPCLTVINMTPADNLEPGRQVRCRRRRVIGPGTDVDEDLIPAQRRHPGGDLLAHRRGEPATLGSDFNYDFHTYSTFARGTDQLGSSYTLLDLTALGRMEDWEEPKGRVSRPHGADPSFTD
jgi:predicted dithiol-disulfide oxidoreductase (DUF899 family)